MSALSAITNLANNPHLNALKKTTGISNVFMAYFASKNSLASKAELLKNLIALLESKPDLCQRVINRILVDLDKALALQKTTSDNISDLLNYHFNEGEGNSQRLSLLIFKQIKTNNPYYLQLLTTFITQNQSAQLLTHLNVLFLFELSQAQRLPLANLRAQALVELMLGGKKCHQLEAAIDHRYIRDYLLQLSLADEAFDTTLAIYRACVNPKTRLGQYCAFSDFENSIEEMVSKIRKHCTDNQLDLMAKSLIRFCPPSAEPLIDPMAVVQTQKTLTVDNYTQITTSIVEAFSQYDLIRANQLLVNTTRNETLLINIILRCLAHDAIDTFQKSYILECVIEQTMCVNDSDGGEKQRLFQAAFIDVLQTLHADVSEYPVIALLTETGLTSQHNLGRLLAAHLSVPQSFYQTLCAKSIAIALLNNTVTQENLYQLPKNIYQRKWISDYLTSLPANDPQGIHLACKNPETPLGLYCHKLDRLDGLFRRNTIANRVRQLTLTPPNVAQELPVSTTSPRHQSTREFQLLERSNGTSKSAVATKS